MTLARFSGEAPPLYDDHFDRPRGSSSERGSADTEEMGHWCECAHVLLQSLFGSLVPWKKLSSCQMHCCELHACEVPGHMQLHQTCPWMYVGL